MRARLPARNEVICTLDGARAQDDALGRRRRVVGRTPGGRGRCNRQCPDGALPFVGTAGPKQRASGCHPRLSRRLRRRRRIQAGVDRHAPRRPLPHPEGPARRQRAGGRGGERTPRWRGPMSRWLTIIGLSEDGLDGLTPAARKLVEQAQTLVGGERHLAKIPNGAAERLPWASPLKLTIDEIVKRRERRVVVLATGDPLWFGIGVTLLRAVPAEETWIVPGVSAFALACARLGWPLAEVECLTLHGRSFAFLNGVVAPDAKLLLLSHDGATPLAVAKALAALGYGPSRSRPRPRARPTRRGLPTRRSAHEARGAGGDPGRPRADAGPTFVGRRRRLWLGRHRVVAQPSHARRHRRRARGGPLRPDRRERRRIGRAASGAGRR